MSEIKVDTLTGKTTANDITVTVGATATQSLEQGLAKAWFEYTSITNTVMTDSFNCSVTTDNGAGDTLLSLTNNMSSSAYVVNASDVTFNTSDNSSYGHVIESTQNAKEKTSSNFTVLYSQHAGSSNLDHCENMGTIHGDLA
jgi:hypothetical protein